MEFTQQINVPKDFFAPTYLLKNTLAFRRMSSEVTIIEGIKYNLWSFSSVKINHGALLIPIQNADHIFIFTLEKHEDVYTVPYRFTNYLNKLDAVVSELKPKTSLYIQY
ncbi:hypothetical protein CBF35_05410 [Vagococcus salmoninarum]|uniref:Uncharacterized protein n=1 Tax=Vagococcus salmoninarum TaxID=2739 RepID=A0A429ZSM6_9ENTE|nr:hypothetical protein CBF35_05410 [Vagococcus salmoninarum]